MQKPSNKSRNNFLVVLLNLWWKQARLLVDRIKSLPQNKKLMKELITLCIGISIVVCVGVWAINTGRCANCKHTMGFLNGDLHLRLCGNCGVEVYLCPDMPHPHQKRCDVCVGSYWDCPTKSGADKHGETICKPLIKGVRPLK